MVPNCTECGLEAKSFDVATGNPTCTDHVTPGAVHFDIRPLAGGGFGVYRVNGKINLLEQDFFLRKNAYKYAYQRIHEERINRLKIYEPSI